MRELWNGSPFKDIIDKVEAEERLTFQDGLRLLLSGDLPLLGYLANLVRRRLHGDRVYYSINLHLNPTNICYLSCAICSFARKPKEEGAYTMTLEEVESRVKHALEEHQINEVHIVGGLHATLPFSYFLEMLDRIRQISPTLWIKAFTAVEIEHFARVGKTTYEDILLQLKAHGLGSLPGGGAEIFAEGPRKHIAYGKINADKWLEVMRVAHRLGIPSNATMLYGHIESPEDLIDHLLRLRTLQDDTKGFYAFVPLAFQPENNALKNPRLTDGYYDLKVYAVSRLLLDNIPHLKAYWSTLGVRMAQVALSYGVNDLSGTSLDEKIMHDAGAPTPESLDRAQIIDMIHRAQREPVEVNSAY